jgi:hypothetical protein
VWGLILISNRHLPVGIDSVGVTGLQTEAWTRNDRKRNTDIAPSRKQTLEI